MRDWKAAYGAPPARFEEAVERALREKEEKRMIHGKRNWTILLVAALIAALLAGMAYAAVESRLLDVLRSDGLMPAADAGEIIERDLGTASMNGVTMKVTEAAYTGKTLNLMIEFGGIPLNSGYPDVAITATEAELSGTSYVNGTAGDAMTKWITAILDGDAPDRLYVSVTTPEGLEVTFALDKTKGDERMLISEETVSEGGALTVYGLTVSMSPLSQVAFLDFQCTLDLAASDYAVEFLDADGNMLDYDYECTNSTTLPDGTGIFRQERILGRDAEIAVVCIYDYADGNLLDQVTIPQI